MRRRAQTGQHLCPSPEAADDVEARSTRRVHMRRFARPVFAVFAILLFMATLASAQDTGTISGTVVDASGQVLPGVTVTLTNERTAAARTLVTNERGEFTFRAVLPDTYTIRIELTGLRTYEQRHNVVNAS